MHIWTALGAREAALLAVLLLLGSGPASLLSHRFDAAMRIALAPILGFCVGTCATTTVLEFAPVNSSYWILIPLVLASVGLALWRTLREASATAVLRRVSPNDLLQILVVCVAVAGPLSYALHERQTVGPTAYYFTDTDNYVGVQDAAKTSSLHDARRAWHDYQDEGKRFADLGQLVYGFVATVGSNLDAGPLGANVTALLGLGATETNSPFFIVLLLAGALGAYATVRRVTRSGTWMAVVGGALFGGPLFLELWFDGFQAALVALGLILPALVLGWEALADRRVANLALFSLVVATMLTVYPLFVPVLAVVATIAIAWLAVGVRRAGGTVTAFLRSLAVPLLSVMAMTIAFDVIGFLRDVTYYPKLINGEIPIPRVGYQLTPEILPGWLLQTREFWYMPSWSDGGFKGILLGALIPFAFLGFAVIGAWRHRFGLALVSLCSLCGIAAYYAYASQDACTYCGERYLLPLAPALAVLLALGLYAVLHGPSRRWQAAAIAGAALVVVAVGQRTRVELNRFIDSSYFLDSATRASLDDMPQDGKAVHIEGYWASATAQAEQPLVYHLATERAPGRVSIALGTNINNALQYLTFGAVLPPGPEFRADYRYVLTRFGGVASGRRTISRRGGIALQERTNPLDITPYAGLALPPVRQDPTGAPYAQPQQGLGFYVVTSGAEGPASARLTFRVAGEASVPRQAGVRSRAARGVLTVCVRATGRGRVRNAAFQLAAPAPATAQLASMRAVAGRCSP
jgi:hypothetical protein